MDYKLPRKIATELLHLAQLSPTQEICGLISAKNAIANNCYPIDNVANQTQQQFQMDERQQINAFAAMRSRNETLFAIYHSHPTTPAFPSAADIMLSAYPEAIYLIISLHTKGVLEMRGFTISDNKVNDIALQLVE